MRRPFPRIPGSPQATTTVETPAHYALTLICCSFALLSEVVIGNVEPTMSFVPKNAAKILKNLQSIAFNPANLSKVSLFSQYLAKTSTSIALRCSTVQVQTECGANANAPRCKWFYHA